MHIITSEVVPVASCVLYFLFISLADFSFFFFFNFPSYQSVHPIKYRSQCRRFGNTSLLFFQQFWPYARVRTLFFPLTDRSTFFLWDFTYIVNESILLLTLFMSLFTAWLMGTSLISTFSLSFHDLEGFLWSCHRITFFYKLFHLKWQVSSTNISVITCNAQCWGMPFWFSLLPFSTMWNCIICCFFLFFLSKAPTDP